MERTIAFTVRVNSASLFSYAKQCTKSIILISFLIFISAGSAIAAQQEANPSITNIEVSPGDTVNFDLTYSTDDSTLTGLGITLYFNSNLLTFNGLTSVLDKNKIAEDTVTQDDSGENRDSDSNTDRRITVAWTDMGGNWPGELSVKLFSVSFTAKDDFSGLTTVNITGEPAAGCSFYSSPVNISLKGDKTSPTVTAPSNQIIEATGTLTNITSAMLGTASVTDDIDTNLSAVPTINGYALPLDLNIGTYTVIWKASDSSGNLGTASQSLIIRDTTPPVVTPPDNITKVATGSSTPVVIGDAAATDAVDGTLVPVPNQTGPFGVGIHVIKWTAIDSSGNIGEAVQTVTILDERPIINFIDQKQVVTLKDTQQTLNIELILNREPSSYPLYAAYKVKETDVYSSGHNAADGLITITSGLKGQISFNIDSNILSSGVELGYLDFEIDSENSAYAKAGRNSSYRVVIKNTNFNLKPSVSISLSQGNQDVRIVSKSGGSVQVTANVTDQNSGDSHDYDWTCNSIRCLKPQAGYYLSSWSFDPSLFEEGVYIIQTEVTDDNSVGGVNGKLSDKTVTAVLVKDSVSVIKDSDGDGIPDDSEPANSENKTNVLDWLSDDGKQKAIRVAQGLAVRLGLTSFSSQNGGAKVTLEQIKEKGGLNGQTAQNADAGDFKFTEDIFDFTVDELMDPGDSVKIVLPLSVPIPDKAVYRKYSNLQFSDNQPAGWRTFVADQENDIRSAVYNNTDEGCPEPGDDSFEIGLLPGAYCVELTIKDGGIYDTDGEENGKISDPGGIAVPTSGDSGSSGGEDSGGGCFIATAAYGSYDNDNVKVLRDFRDSFLLKSHAGRILVNFYYKNSPPLADYISEYPSVKKAVRFAITPLVYSINYPIIALIFLISIFGFLIKKVRHKNKLSK